MDNDIKSLEARVNELEIYQLNLKNRILQLEEIERRAHIAFAALLYTMPHMKRFVSEDAVREVESGKYLLFVEGSMDGQPGTVYWLAERGVDKQPQEQ